MQGMGECECTDYWRMRSREKGVFEVNEGVTGEALGGGNFLLKGGGICSGMVLRIGKTRISIKGKRGKMPRNSHAGSVRYEGRSAMFMGRMHGAGDTPRGDCALGAMEIPGAGFA